MNLPFVDGIRRADRDNTIDVYISEDEHDDVLHDGAWQQFFKTKPEVLTMEEKKAWIAQNTKVALGSDAFFPFGDNIERAHKSGVEFIAQAGGSVRDDHVIMTCDKYGFGRGGDKPKDDGKKVKTKAKKKQYITGAHGSGSARQKAKYREQRANRHKK